MADKTHKSLWIIPPHNTHPIVLSGSEAKVSELTELEESSLSKLGLDPNKKISCSPVGKCAYVFIDNCGGISVVACDSLVYCGDVSGCNTLKTECPTLKLP